MVKPAWHDLKITMITSFGYKVKYSENSTAQKITTFHGLKKAKKHILNQKGGKF